MTENRRWRPELTGREQVLGLVFFALYCLIFPGLKMVVEQFFDRRFGLYLSEAMSAAVYYIILNLLAILLFRRFLKSAWAVLMDRLPENLLAFFAGLVGAGVLHFLVALLPCPVQNPTPASWAEQYAYSPAATIVIVVLLMPLIEEVLFRGLVFGSLRPYSRTLAWIASMLLFLLYSVWTFAIAYRDARYLVLVIYYLPMTLALTWCRDQGESVWTTVFLHAAINGFALFRAV